MNKWWFLLVSLPAIAGTIPVSVQVTSTQAVLSYSVPDDSPCTVSLPSAADLNESWFPGSSQDDPSQGRIRQFVIGKRTANLATDGKMRSRALSADTYHPGGSISCGNTAGTFDLKTNTIPLGDSSPNLYPFDLNGFGHIGFPDIDYSDNQASYTDPQTGAILKPLPMAGYAAAGINRNQPISYVYDLGGAWANPSSLLSGGSAIYTGAGGQSNALFFPLHLNDGGRGWMFYLVAGIDDLKIHLTAGSSLSGDSLMACLTEGGTNQCVGTPFSISIPNGAPADSVGPGDVNTFQFRWKGWGSPKLTEDQTSQPPNPTVSVSHSIVTLTTPSPSSTPYMFPSAAPGTRIHIGGTEYTVQSVDSATQLTIREDAGIIPSAPYSIENWGVLVWPAPTDTPRNITIKGANVDFAHSADFFVGVDGGYRFCQGADVTVSFQADGVTPMPTTPGKLCMMQSNWNDAVVGGSRQYFAVLVKATGELRILNRLGIYGNTQDPGDPYTVYEADPVGNVSKCTYDAASGKFKSLPKDWNNNTMNPAMTCTAGVLTGAIAQITAAYPQIDQSYFPFRFAGKFGNFVAYGAQVFSQDSMAMGCAFDLSRPAGTELLGCIDTWSHFGLRWGQSHGQGFAPFTNTGWFKFFSGVLGGNGSPLGPYVMPVMTVYGNGGSKAITPTFRDPLTCEALGVDPQWAKYGATGANCIRVNVPEEPLVFGKSPGDPQLSITRTVGPHAYPHNRVACGGDGLTPVGLAGNDCAVALQPALEGDWVTDWTSPGTNAEFFLIAKKSKLPDGSIDLVLSRHVSAGNWPADNSQAWCVGSDGWHSGNWALVMYPVKECTGNVFAVNALEPTFRTNPTWIADDPNAYGSHSALLYSPANGYYSHWSVGSGHLGGNQGGPGFYGFGYGISSGHFPEIFSQRFPQMSVTDELPFAYDASGAQNVQAHPGVNVRLDLNGNPIVTGLDGRPFGGSHGGTPSPFDQSATLVAGTLHVVKMGIPTNGSVPNIKTKALLGWYGHTILQDLSGPNSASSFGDQTLDALCFTYKSGECIGGSATGDVYVSMLNPDLSGYCVVNMMARTPCVSSVARHVFMYTQFQLSSDPLGNRSRVLTSYLNTPGSQENYANQHGGDDADWFIGWSRYVNGGRSTMMGVREPPMTEDSVNRTSFVPIPITLSGRGGDQVRIRFGYDQNLYCTSRQEQCSTGAAPFGFVASDNVSWQNCGSGCTVMIPAYANRVLYYTIDRKGSFGQITSSPIQAVAVP